jgi:hypothetical protein
MLYNYPAYESAVRAGLIEKGKWNVEDANFKRRCAVPYLHQAHHLIPNGILNGCILDVATQAKSYSLYKLIRSGLLEAKYNLNHKLNMMILPMKRKHGITLKLPTHLRPSAREHDKYSKLVETKVKQVIEDFAKALNEGQDDKKHEAPPNKLSRAKLERISGQLREMVRTWGKIGWGMTLDEHAESR